MSSGNEYERLFKLWATVAKLVVDGKRQTDRVADALQEIVDKLTFSDFFQTRPGLWVSDGFRDRVLARASDTAAVEVKHFDLPRAMLDSEIEAELGEGHIWGEGELCATLQKLVEEQWGGKEGELVNNGYANLFYTVSCVVFVFWDAVGGGWHINTWRRDDRRWYAGNRAFSRN